MSHTGLLLWNPAAALHITPGPETNSKIVITSASRKRIQSSRSRRVASTTYAVCVTLQLKN